MNKPTIPTTSNSSNLKALFHKACRFFMGLYAILLIEFILLFSSLMQVYDYKSLFFVVCVSLTYPLLYMLPSMIIIFFGIYILGIFKLNGRYNSFIIYAFMVLWSGITMLFLFADFKIYSMFNFHINSFVLNLILTPGGIESMGASNIDTIVISLLALGSFSFAALLLWLTNWTMNKSPIPIKKEITLVIILFVCLIGLSVAEKVDFAYCTYKNYPSVFYNSQKVPFYILTRMKKLFRSLNIAEPHKDNIKLDMHKSSLHYPLMPLKIAAIKKPPNIVWLVAESWRADTLNSEIMPATSKFAEKCLYLHNHYSSGNGTRMALFGMFYGLYGSYWDVALSENTTPVIMQVLKKLNYQFQMYTSAKFTYPEFDKTIFSNIDSKNLHQSGTRGGFINDRENIGKLLSFIRNRDKQRPFMTFMFFESPHAPYTFPDDCIIRKDYLPTFNYSTVNISANINKIKNRYLNSVHHLDSQLDRVFNFLQHSKLMDNTIIIVAGDHGEEFMEKGHWGHNQSFHEEQIRTPLLIYIPTIKHQDIQFMSSHLDVVPTIAPFIGITNPPEDYSLGYNLLGNNRRAYTACSSWDKICYIDNKFKYELSPTQYNRMTTVNDAEVTKAQKKRLNKPQVFNLMKNTSRFYAK